MLQQNVIICHYSILLCDMTRRIKQTKFTNIFGNVFNQILYLETLGNNSRHVDKCYTAGLGNSTKLFELVLSPLSQYAHFLQQVTMRLQTQRPRHILHHRIQQVRFSLEPPVVYGLSQCSVHFVKK